MIETALYISLWAYLFCVPLSEPGQVFGGGLKVIQYEGETKRIVKQ